MINALVVRQSNHQEQINRFCLFSNRLFAIHIIQFILPICSNSKFPGIRYSVSGKFTGMSSDENLSFELSSVICSVYS